MLVGVSLSYRKHGPDMTHVKKTAVPDGALPAKYLRLGGYHTDCFETKVEGDISLARFVEAFYTGALFKCERLILKLAAARPSTDANARAIACGETTRFAAWDMEERTDTQMILCDMNKATRSWFMVEPSTESSTWLRFGSVVSPKPGTTELPTLIRPLMPLHEVYSILLLKGAVRRLPKINVELASDE